MAVAVRLEWEKDSEGYDLVNHVAQKRSGDSLLGGGPSTGLYIVARNGKPESLKFQGIDKKVHLRLASAELTPDGALAFTNEFGFLPALHRSGDPFSGPAIDVTYDFFDLAGSIRRLVSLAHAKAWKEIKDAIDVEEGIGRLAANVLRSPGPTLPQVYIQPKSLMSFIYLEFLQSLSDALEIRRCSHCGTFFSVGVEAGTSRKREYCEDRCRKAAYRLRKQGEAEVGIRN